MNTTTPRPPEPFEPGPEKKIVEPATPGEPKPSPEEIPWTEPKHYPIHPEIPVQPIHETDVPRADLRGSEFASLLWG